MEIDSTAGAPTSKGLGSHLEDAPDSQNAQASLDAGLQKRPRDAHTIHLILNQYGVNAYQERVPLQLMDFAYRYTSGILQDSFHFINESYPGLQANSSGAGGASGSKSNPETGFTINLSALRLAIRSRTHYQYNPTLSKEFYTDLMTEKNKTALPPVQADAGLNLPPEQYMLTGQHWDMGESFDLMETDLVHTDAATATNVIVEGVAEDDEEVEGGTMEDLFGRSGGAGEDETMED